MKVDITFTDSVDPKTFDNVSLAEVVGNAFHHPVQDDSSKNVSAKLIHPLNRITVINETHVHMKKPAPIPDRTVSSCYRRR